MAKGLYLRMAKGNLMRNKQLYVPYFIASVIMSAMFFIIVNMVFSDSMANIERNSTIWAMLVFGVVVMALFVFGYMLYLNSFLIKRRKKEFGLYGILGLEKRHVGCIIMLEGLILSSLSLFCGLVCGTVFGKLMFMLLMAVTHLSAGSVFYLSAFSYIVTAVYFAVIFIAGTFYNILKVRLSSPIDLLHGEKQGEKKLKAVLPLSIFGLICLGTAYYFSITVDITGLAVSIFWPAVILVIIGTFAVFAAASQLLLNALKKNKRIYYKPQNFINISSLTYRLKQNAAGLSNICILSTMVIVTVSICCALYFGQEKILQNQNPNDCKVTLFYDMSLTLDDKSFIEQTALETARENGVELENVISYEALRDSIMLMGGEFTLKSADATIVPEELSGYNYIYSAYIVPLNDYNRVCETNETLENDEIIILSNYEVAHTESFKATDKTYRIKGVYDDTLFTDGKNGENYASIFFVTSNDMCEAFQRSINPGLDIDRFAGESVGRLCVNELNIGGETENRVGFENALPNKIYEAASAKLNAPVLYEQNGIDLSRQSSYQIYGGLLFLGVFFAVLFLINTVIVMYFKQISEGYEDRERFVILQKIGMNDEEVKKTINSQVLIVFFLPLLLAVLHMLAASNLIVQMLAAFVMTDTALTLLWIAITTAAFCAVYVLVFRATAKAYYRIVKW